MIAGKIIFIKNGMKFWDINNSNRSEAHKLLKELKNPINILDYKDVYNQIVQSTTYDDKTYRCLVIDKINQITYDFSIHTTAIDTRFSITLRFKKNNIHLIRLDFVDYITHTNNIGTPQEEKIRGATCTLFSASW